MPRPHRLTLFVLGALLSHAANAAPSASAQTPAPVHARASVRARASAHARAATPVAAAPRATLAPTRTLDDIHIEGEIPVPQVLFITARDQRRFMEFQHRRYLKSGRQLGESSELPDRIVVTRSHPITEKEIPR